MREDRNETSRTKLRLLLTPSELEKLDAAVQDTGTNRSFILLEAMQAGLADPNLKIDQEKRTRRIDAWTTSRMKEKLRQLAAKLNITQQHLTRTLLLNYLTTSPWNQPKPHQQEPTEGGVNVEAAA